MLCLNQGEAPFKKTEYKAKGEKNMEKTIARPAYINETKVRRDLERKILKAELTKREIFLLLLKIKEISGNRV